MAPDISAQIQKLELDSTKLLNFARRMHKRYGLRDAAATIPAEFMRFYGGSFEVGVEQDDGRIQARAVVTADDWPRQLPRFWEAIADRKRVCIRPAGGRQDILTVTDVPTALVDDLAFDGAEWGHVVKRSDDRCDAWYRLDPATSASQHDALMAAIRSRMDDHTRSRQSGAWIDLPLSGQAIEYAHWTELVIGEVLWAAERVWELVIRVTAALLARIRGEPVTPPEPERPLPEPMVRSAETAPAPTTPVPGTPVPSAPVRRRDHDLEL